MICPRCLDPNLFSSECDCGYKKPSETTIVKKDFDYSEEKTVKLEETLAYQLSPMEKKRIFDEIRKQAPLRQSGATKEQVSSYWMKHVKSILGKS